MTKRAKISWASRKLHKFSKIIGKLSLGLTLTEEHSKLGLGLGLASSTLDHFSSCDTSLALSDWEYMSDYMINSMIGSWVLSDPDFMYADVESDSNDLKTKFRKLDPEGTIWVATFKGIESWWYPDFKTGIQAFLKSERYWRITSRDSIKKSFFSLEKEKKEELEESSFVQEKIQEISPYLKEEENRCLLFTGPPGTGKSSILLQLANKLVDSYIRVPFPIAKKSSFWGLLDLINFQGVIIDDIDHGEIDNVLLENLERAKKKTSLILLSSNSISSLKGALLRPGRVDLIYEVIEPPEDLVEKLSTNIPPEKKKDLKGLYISYIKEIDTRCRIHGIERIDEWLLEMHERVDQVGDGWSSSSSEKVLIKEEETFLKELTA